MRPLSPSKRAFTLVELLTVIAIIAVLSAIMLPSLRAVMRSADAAKCLSNLREIGRALNVYIAENNGLMPGAGIGSAAGSPNSYPLSNPPNLNWFSTIFSYVPMAKNRKVDILKQNDYSQIFYCPTYVKNFCDENSTTKWTYSGYGFNNRLYYAQGERVSYGEGSNLRMPLETVVFPSRTIIVGDSTGWMLTPAENGVVPLPSTLMGNSQVHSGSAHYLYVDGHVEALTPDEAANMLKLRQSTGS